MFCVFLVDFHSARLFFACYGFLLSFFGQVLGLGGVGDEPGSVFSFCVFCIFWVLGPFFWHFFLVSVAIWAFSFLKHLFHIIGDAKS